MKIFYKSSFLLVLCTALLFFLCESSHAGGGDSDNYKDDNCWCNIFIDYHNGNSWPGGIKIEWVTGADKRGPATIKEEKKGVHFSIDLDDKVGDPKCVDHKFRIQPKDLNGVVKKMGNRTDARTGEVECDLDVKNRTFSCR